MSEQYITVSKPVTSLSIDIDAILKKERKKKSKKEIKTERNRRPVFRLILAHLRKIYYRAKFIQKAIYSLKIRDLSN